jgi:hypothetical protein
MTQSIAHITLMNVYIKFASSTPEPLLLNTLLNSDIHFMFDNDACICVTRNQILIGFKNLVPVPSTVDFEMKRDAPYVIDTNYCYQALDIDASNSKNVDRIGLEVAIEYPGNNVLRNRYSFDEFKQLVHEWAAL